MILNTNLRTLTLQDIELLSNLPRFTSLRALARATEQEPAQVTRSLKRIEALLGFEILNRTTSGSSLTELGLIAAQHAHNVVTSARMLTTKSFSQESKQVLHFGSRSFLNAFAATNVLAKVCVDFPKIHLRVLDMSPEDLKVAEHKRALHIAMYLGELEWTSSWSTNKVGDLRWQAFVQPTHKLAKKAKVTLNMLKEENFVGPSYWAGGAVREGDDGFPLSLQERKIIVEVQNAQTAAEFAAHTNAIAFIPCVVAAPLVAIGKLLALTTNENFSFLQPIYLAMREDIVPKKLERFLLEETKSIFSAI